MKRLAPFFVILCFFAFVLIIITKTKADIEIKYVNAFDDEYIHTLKVCVLNKDNRLVLVDVEKHNDEDIYTYVLKVYDHYRNNLPLEYLSPLKGNFEVVSVNKNKEELEIVIKILYLHSTIEEFLTALSWSYKELGIKKVNLIIDDKKFTLNTNANINVIIEDIDFQTKQVIYYFNDGEIIPVTYFHNQNEVDFLINKIKNKFPSLNAKKEVYDNLLIIEFIDEEEVLSTEVINLIIKSLEDTRKYSNIIIIVNDKYVYNN